MKPECTIETTTEPGARQESATATTWSSKLQQRHFERTAIVYVRQSTAHQVLNHRESTARQYSLVNLAVQLGWPPDRVEVIDEDQGQSGSSAEGRNGFKRLLAEVSLDHVGVILGIELSRLARSNKDWHQLIELCAIFGTMLADQDGLYNPTDYNDRLLLGLRGIMNEAELHVLQGRMHQALLNKAKRGEVYVRAPIGYVKHPTGGLGLDPDEQAQSVVRLIFDEFERRGSVRSVLRFLQQNGIRLPIRPHAGPNKGQLEWRQVTPTVLNRMLKHEVYAGMYRFGHRQTDPRRKVAGRPGSGRAVVTPDKYHALIPNHCPSYISEEQYRRNQQRIRENGFGETSKGAARSGQSLLAGIVFCGKCGRRMTVAYSGEPAVMRYYCTTGVVDFQSDRCQSLSGKQLDELVTDKVLKILKPASLEISLIAAEDIDKQQRQLDDNWKQRLERAQIEVDRAHRQYQLVEPENRLVVRELERQWEAALDKGQKLEQEYARFLQTQLTRLSDDQRAAIRSLAENVPAIWRSPTTENSDRQRLVRLLVERVEVVVQGTTERVDVSLRWSGGFTSHHELVRPVRRYDQTADFERLKARIAELKVLGRSYAEIATSLNEEGFQPANQTKRFNQAIVGRLAKKFCADLTSTGNRAAVQCEQNEWTVAALSKELSIPRTTLQTWKNRGWLHVIRRLPGIRGQIIYWADDRELDRLRRLRRTKWHFGDPPLPEYLTTPLLNASGEC
jgi:DNA invertase Pin-like site-specific DNA recombinase